MKLAVAMKRLIITSVIVTAIAATAAVSHSSLRRQASQNFASGFGAISGVVFDEGGRPLVGATVYSRPSGQPSNGRVKTVPTDKEGKFFLDKVPPGLNTVHGFKEEDGYPDTFFAFYVTDPRAIPQVGVYQQQVTDVVVQLGPKAAKMIIQVFDADTNDQIESAAIELRRPEDPNAYVSLSCIPSEATGKCEILVPPLPTNIKVTKSGYEEQDVTGQLGPRTDVATLNPGETKNLSIRLRRKKVQP
jgi:hypothetical protein